MKKVTVYNIAGEKVGELSLKDEVFGVDVKSQLVSQAYQAIYANKREVIAHTKDRSERRGSGAKPWRQKGTGRARVGTVRTPIWRKGGIVFGPTNNRNFSKKINRKMNRLALKMVFSAKAADGELFVVDQFKLKENKTKEIAGLVGKLKLSGSMLFSFSREEKETARASRNIVNSENISTDKLNVFDMLNKKNLILSKDSIKYLEDKYSEKISK